MVTAYRRATLCRISQRTAGSRLTAMNAATAIWTSRSADLVRGIARRADEQHAERRPRTD